MLDGQLTCKISMSDAALSIAAPRCSSLLSAMSAPSRRGPYTWSSQPAPSHDNSFTNDALDRSNSNNDTHCLSQRESTASTRQSSSQSMLQSNDSAPLIQVASLVSQHPLQNTSSQSPGSKPAPAEAPQSPEHALALGAAIFQPRTGSPSLEPSAPSSTPPMKLCRPPNLSSSTSPRSLLTPVLHPPPEPRRLQLPFPQHLQPRAVLTAAARVKHTSSDSTSRRIRPLHMVATGPAFTTLFQIRSPTRQPRMLRQLPSIARTESQCLSDLGFGTHSLHDSQSPHLSLGSTEAGGSSQRVIELISRSSSLSLESQREPDPANVWEASEAQRSLTMGANGSIELPTTSSSADAAREIFDERSSARLIREQQLTADSVAGTPSESRFRSSQPLGAVAEVAPTNEIPSNQSTAVTMSLLDDFAAHIPSTEAERAQRDLQLEALERIASELEQEAHVNWARTSHGTHHLPSLSYSQVSQQAAEPRLILHDDTDKTTNAANQASSSDPSLNRSLPTQMQPQSRLVFEISGAAPSQVSQPRDGALQRATVAALSLTVPASEPPLLTLTQQASQIPTLERGEATQEPHELATVLPPAVAAVAQSDDQSSPPAVKREPSIIADIQPSPQPWPTRPRARAQPTATTWHPRTIVEEIDLISDSDDDTSPVQHLATESRSLTITTQQSLSAVAPAVASVASPVVASASAVLVVDSIPSAAPILHSQTRGQQTVMPKPRRSLVQLLSHATSAQSSPAPLAPLLDSALMVREGENVSDLRSSIAIFQPLTDEKYTAPASIAQSTECTTHGIPLNAIHEAATNERADPTILHKATITKVKTESQEVTAAELVERPTPAHQQPPNDMGAATANSSEPSPSSIHRPSLEVLPASPTVVKQEGGTEMGKVSVLSVQRIGQLLHDSSNDIDDVDTTACVAEPESELTLAVEDIEESTPPSSQQLAEMAERERARKQKLLEDKKRKRRAAVMDNEPRSLASILLPAPMPPAIDQAPQQPHDTNGNAAVGAVIADGGLVVNAVSVAAVTNIRNLGAIEQEQREIRPLSPPLLKRKVNPATAPAADGRRSNARSQTAASSTQPVKRRRESLVYPVDANEDDDAGNGDNNAITDTEADDTSIETLYLEREQMLLDNAAWRTKYEEVAEENHRLRLWVKQCPAKDMFM